MKGQYRVLTEVMIFGIGIAITSFIIVSFQTVQENVSELSLKDNLMSVSNLIATSIVKVAESGTASINLKIPDSIAKETYLISVDNDMVFLQLIRKPNINASQQLFNITKNHNIIVRGNVLDSSSGYLRISSDDGVNINVREWGV